MEKITESKFQKLTKEEMMRIKGGKRFLGCGFNEIHADQTMASINGRSQTGDYGHYSVFWIRVSKNGVRSSDQVDCSDDHTGECND